MGYYTEVAGLGASPAEVTINGKIEVYNRCLNDGGTSNCVALRPGRSSPAVASSRTRSSRS
jgi:hypothetical protein